MKLPLKLLFFIITICLFSISCVIAQEKKPISFFANEPNPVIVNYFNNIVGQKTRLYNGPHYEFDSQVIQGNALYNSSIEFVTGTVNYDGYRFEQVPLLYDIFRDVLITKVYDYATAFTLFSSKVDDFYINNHHFIKIKESTDKDALRPGFYDLVHDGKVKFLVKRTKTIQEKLGNVVQKYFLESSSYYILKDNTYYKISSQSSLMSLFKDEKQLFKKKLKEADINFRKTPEEAIFLLVNYYNTLKN